MTNIFILQKSAPKILPLFLKLSLFSLTKIALPAEASIPTQPPATSPSPTSGTDRSLNRGERPRRRHLCRRAQKRLCCQPFFYSTTSKLIFKFIMSAINRSLEQSRLEIMILAIGVLVLVSLLGLFVFINLRFRPRYERKELSHINNNDYVHNEKWEAS